MLNNQVGTTFIGNGPSERGLDLLGDAEIVKDGKLAFIQLYDIGPFRGDEGDVVLDFVEYGLVVHVYALERGVEQVAQQAYGTAGFLVDERGELGGFLDFHHGVFPVFDQYFKFSVEFGHALAFGHRADDDAEVLGLDAHEQLLQACPFFARLNFLRYGNLVVERDEYQVSSGKG